MQVAVLTEQLHAPVPGGTGRYTSDLLAALAAASPADGRVIRWTARHRGIDSGPGNSRHDDRRFPLGRRALALAWSFGAGPKPSDAAVVHAPTVLAPPRGETPLVVTVHDDVPWSQPQTLTRYGAQWHRRIGRRIAEEADVVLTPTRAVAGRLLRVLPRLHPERLMVAANPLPGRRGALLGARLPDEQDRARRLGLPDTGYLLFVGTREPRKGLDVLLSALAQPGGPRLPLLLVGPDGWGSVDLRDGGDRVRPLGRLDEADLGVVYRQATVLVLPSRSEGFGYPVVEAMAAGTAVVTSDDPALVETGGGATITAPVGDAAALAQVLRRVEDDGALRHDLAEHGRERVREFDDVVYGRTLWRLYEGL